jgi:hypothetical protein
MQPSRQAPLSMNARWPSSVERSTPVRARQVVAPKVASNSAMRRARHGAGDALGLAVVADPDRRELPDRERRTRDRAAGRAAIGDAAVEGHRRRAVARVREPERLLEDDEGGLGAAVGVRVVEEQLTGTSAGTLTGARAGVVAHRLPRNSACVSGSRIASPC